MLQKVILGSIVVLCMTWGVAFVVYRREYLDSLEKCREGRYRMKTKWDSYACATVEQCHDMLPGLPVDGECVACNADLNCKTCTETIDQCDACPANEYVRSDGSCGFSQFCVGRSCEHIQNDDSPASVSTAALAADILFYAAQQDQVASSIVIQGQSLKNPKKKTLKQKT